MAENQYTDRRVRQEAIIARVADHIFMKSQKLANRITFCHIANLMAVKPGIPYKLASIHDNNVVVTINLVTMYDEGSSSRIGGHMAG